MNVTMLPWINLPGMPAKKNAFIFITKNLNRLKPKEVFETEIRAYMGEINVLNIYFKSDDKGKLTGVCNVQCLSAAVYKIL